MKGDGDRCGGIERIGGKKSERVREERTLVEFQGVDGAASDEGVVSKGALVRRQGLGVRRLDRAS